MPVDINGGNDDSTGIVEIDGAVAVAAGMVDLWLAILVGVFLSPNPKSPANGIAIVTSFIVVSGDLIPAGGIEGGDSGGVDNNLDFDNGINKDVHFSNSLS